eukprot:scaffold55913_cov30-Prasinocladus_malaysianus.AAC.1
MHIEYKCYWDYWAVDKNVAFANIEKIKAKQMNIYMHMTIQQNEYVRREDEALPFRCAFQSGLTP